MKVKNENIFITWHFTSHGISFLKSILSAFYTGLCNINEKDFLTENISQHELLSAFDTYEGGFLFDKIYYLTSSQDSFDKISSRRFIYRKNICEDEEIINKGTEKLWKEIVEQNFENIQKDIDFVKQNYAEKFDIYLSQLWRDVHNQTIKDQIDWFTELSNAAKYYKERFEEKYIEIPDFRDSSNIAEKLSPVIEDLKRKHKTANFFINVVLGSNETQVVWHVFSENFILPKNTKLFATYDLKNEQSEGRFSKFAIKEVPQNLLSLITNKITFFSESQSPKRKLAGIKMKNYIEQGFAILLLGERGVGKTALVKEYRKQNKPFVEANCASFDDDSKAEAELFGYKKGAFTGAITDTDGLFQKAHGGILFLDEVHHLSRRVQAKMMTALQTNDNNFYTIRKIGDSRIERVRFTIIFASNKTIDELRQIISNDLFDRITQLIIEIPALSETVEDREEDWQKTWEHMKFGSKDEAPTEPELIKWLKSLKLYGNFRDLQKIAIYYKTFLDFSKQEQKELKFDSPFEFAKAEFQKYISTKNVDNFQYHELFDSSKPTKELIANFQKNLAEKLIKEFEGADKAAKHFQAMNETLTARTLYKWKNGK